MKNKNDFKLNNIVNDIKQSIDARTDDISSISQAIEAYTANQSFKQSEALKTLEASVNSDITETYNTLCNIKDNLIPKITRNDKILKTVFKILVTYKLKTNSINELIKFLVFLVACIFLSSQVFGKLDNTGFIQKQCEINSNVHFCQK